MGSRRQSTSGEQLVDRARQVVPVLARESEQTERNLRPTAESLAAVRDAGFFALGAPREFGGMSTDLRTQVLVLSELGRGCPSTAWIVGLNAGKRLLDDLLTGRVRDEVFADPDAVLCTSGLPTGGSGGTEGPDGLRVSGRWRIASGCEDAAFATLAVPVLVDGEPVKGCLAIVPTKELSVERTWRVIGMRGTGSHTLVAEDVLVPPTHLVFPAAGADGAPKPLMPPVLLLGTIVDMLAPLVGAARGALDAVAALLAGSHAPKATTYRRTVESPLARHWFAEATQLVGTASRRVLQVAGILDDLARDATLPVQERAPLRMELATAAQECRDAMEKLMDLHGTSGFAEDEALQRFWRDVAVGTRHVQFTPYLVAEDYARVLLDAGRPVSLTL